MKTRNCTIALSAGTFFARLTALSALAVLPFVAACSPQKSIETAAESLSAKASEADPEGARATRLREASLKLAKLDPKEFESAVKGETGRKLVSEAASLGQFPLLKALVEAGAPVDGNTAFPSVCAAALSGNAEITEWLLRNGADVNARATRGDITPLFFALDKQNAEIVSLLLKNGADVNAPCAVGVMRPLDVAVSKKDAELVKLLLANGADVNAENELSWTPLHEAAHDGEAELVRLLLDAGAKPSLNRKAASELKFLSVTSRISAGEEATKEIPSMAFRTPLALAVEGGNAEIVKMLVDAGADVNGNGVLVLEKKSWGQRSNVYTEAPLAALAARGRKTELLKILVEAGANPRGEFELAELAKDGKIEKKKWTFPQVVVECGDAGLFAKILPADADVNVPFADGTPMISRAAVCGNVDLLNLLIGKGADIEKKDAQFLSPLAYAAAAGNAETVKLLLEKGAKPDSGLRGNKTPLWQAVIADKPETIALLLAAGADYRVEDADEHDVIDYAITKDLPKVLKTLLEKLDVSLQNEEQLFESIRKNRSPELVEVLLSHGLSANAVTNTIMPSGRRDSQHRESVLYSTVTKYEDEEKCRKIISLLIEHGADVNAKNQIVEYFGEKNPNMWTALEGACFCGKREIAEMLLKKGAEIRESGVVFFLLKGKCKKSEEKADFLKFLIFAGADVNSRFKYVSERSPLNGVRNGDTPLFQCLSDLDCAKVLIENGANPNAKDMSGNTVLDRFNGLPRYRRNQDVKELLVNMGAKSGKELR